MFQLWCTYNDNTEYKCNDDDDDDDDDYGDDDDDDDDNDDDDGDDDDDDPLIHCLGGQRQKSLLLSLAHSLC